MEISEDPTQCSTKHRTAVPQCLSVLCSVLQLAVLAVQRVLKNSQIPNLEVGNAKPTASAMATKPDNASSLRFDPLQVEDFKRRKVAGDEYNSTSTSTSPNSVTGM